MTLIIVSHILQSLQVITGSQKIIVEVARYIIQCKFLYIFFSATLLWKGIGYFLWYMQNLHIIVYCLTTSNIITIGLFTKTLGSGGRGSIWIENTGETGYWGTAVLCNVSCCTSHLLLHSQITYPDGSLRTLLFVIIVLAIVSFVESVVMYITKSHNQVAVTVICN